MVSRPNKFLLAPFAVRRGFCLRLGASGVGDPRISSRSRAMVAGGPSALAVWVLRWAMDAGRRRPFFFLVGGRSCFARADGPAAVLDWSDDSSSLPSGRDTFRGTQSQRWRRLLQVCWIDVHALSALVSRKEEAAWRQCTEVEDDDLLATGCRSFCCRGLLSRFRDDDTGLRRSSCVMVALGYSRCSWSFVFAFQCACNGQLLCINL